VNASPDFSSKPRRRRPEPFDLGLLGVGLLTLLVAGYATGTSWAEFKRARQHVTDIRRDTQAAQEQLKSLEARAAPTAALATQALLSADAPPPRVLSELAALMPPDVKLESVALTYADGIGIQMQVSAKGGASYDAFLQRLEGSPLFDEVVPGEETRDGGVAASVQARYRGGSR
jgi:Tfp pilus assembly protein PilN